MAWGCAAKAVKFLVFIVKFLAFIAGMAILIAGIIALTVPAFSQKIIQELHTLSPDSIITELRTAFYLAIAVGAIIMPLGFILNDKAHKEKLAAVTAITVAKDAEITTLKETVNAAETKRRLAKTEYLNLREHCVGETLRADREKGRADREKGRADRISELFNTEKERHAAEMAKLSAENLRLREEAANAGTPGVGAGVAGNAVSLAPPPPGHLAVVQNIPAAFNTP